MASPGGTADDELNSQAQALFGYTYSELEGKSLEALLPERYAISPRIRPMGTGLELYGQHKDGSEFSVDISLSPLLFDCSLPSAISLRESAWKHVSVRPARQQKLAWRSCSSSWMSYPPACIS